MQENRRFKPFWRWEVFLFAMVLVSAMAANVVTRADWPVWTPVLAVLLLAIALGFAAALVVPLLRGSGRDSENTLRTIGSLEPVPLAEVAAAAGDDTPVHRMELEGSERRQTSIDAAQATSRTLRAVLTPDASRWLGRELRVAVDLVGDDGRVYRAGFVPRHVDARLNRLVHLLAAEGRVAEVPVQLVGTARPFTVEIVA
ncbi:hypothetical protein SCB71_10880 [Herbiconiux sp. KACC 21604]|uniref:hypothetical protein n=1 Tax=unclassified Herbiconiux TaxID=2618217 RepID=UPI001491F095|nr:hypothetical protein [Herbiconiux sp. SALV-R1]QJU53726.1 hypothetical protein HL652_08830 [Herbiconiux sp. SALV-R1]WPO84729.1 hypothetical protein SCB71_10880 [Herbiconiux sp. KACC 21604]